MIRLRKMGNRRSLPAPDPIDGGPLMARPEIATLLALSSALGIATGDVLQQQAAHRITDTSVGHIALFASLLRNQRWWWGAVLLAASIALQAAALSQGSVLLV